MDTKFLYDALRDHGVKIKECDPEGAGEYWFEAIIKAPDYLADIYLDLLEEEMSSREDHGDLQNVLKFTASASEDTDNLLYKSRSEILTPSYATSYGWHVSMVGRCVVEIIRRQLRKYIELRQEEWFGDVAAYDYDMREGERGDWLYEQRRDRELDERL
jgi:hypothetical protein